MTSIYYAVKAVAFFGILMTFYIFLLGGSRSEKEDRGSKYLIMITLTTVLPIIGYTVDTGPTARGTILWGFPLISYLGFLIFFIGIIIHLTGISTLNKQWSIVVAISKDHQLIDTGIYKHIRHPIYAGIPLELLGFGVALANWISILVLVLPNGVTLAYRIIVEEKALEKRFGKAYIDYVGKTKRLIPGIF